LPDERNDPEERILRAIFGRDPERSAPPLDESSEVPAPGLYPVDAKPKWFADPHSMRGVIALILVSVSGVVVLGALAVAAFEPNSVDGVVRVLGLLLSFLGGLVGAVTGFYYGRTSSGR
jgi:hypothetical protein